MHSEIWLEESVGKLPKARVTVFGDFCMDVYWFFDKDDSELSVETGLPVRRVRQQRYSPGGAGNVIANLVDLGVKDVRAIGVAGTDVFGAAFLNLLKARNVNLDGFEVVEDWQTMVYAKPTRGDEEQNRLDFGAFNVASEELQIRLMKSLDAAAKKSDVVILNQQVPGGLS